MRTNRARRVVTAAFVTLAVLPFVGCGRDEIVVHRTDAPVEVTHGGTVITLGGTQVEIVHDATKGTLTVYELRAPNRAPVAFEEAPIVELRTAGGVVPVTLARVEGEPGMWRATNVALETGTFNSARLVARLEGRRFDEPILTASLDTDDEPIVTPSLDTDAEPTTAATPASLPPQEPREPEITPAPRAFEEATPSTSPRVLSLEGGGTVRLVAGPDAQAPTIHVLDADGQPLAADKVVLVFGTGATKEVPLERVEGESAAWKPTTSDVDVAVAGRIVVTVAGSERTASFPASWSAPAPTTSATTEPAAKPEMTPAQDADPAAASKTDPAVSGGPRAPEQAAKPAAPVSGTEPAEEAKSIERQVVIEGVGTATLAHDAKTGNVTVRIVDAEGKAVDAQKVVLVVADGSTQEEIVLSRADGESPSFAATNAALKAVPAGRLVVTIEGQEHSGAFSGAAPAPKDAAPRREAEKPRPPADAETTPR